MSAELRLFSDTPVLSLDAHDAEPGARSPSGLAELNGETRGAVLA
jgi:hypothetical protein